MISSHHLIAFLNLFRSC